MNSVVCVFVYIYACARVCVCVCTLRFSCKHYFDYYAIPVCSVSFCYCKEVVCVKARHWDKHMNLCKSKTAWSWAWPQQGESGPVNMPYLNYFSVCAVTVWDKRTPKNSYASSTVKFAKKLSLSCTLWMTGGSQGHPVWSACLRQAASWMA